MPHLALTVDSAAYRPLCSVAVPQADFDAHRVAQRNRSGTGEIDRRFTLAADDQTDPRHQRPVRRHGTGGVVIRELQAARRARRGVWTQRARDWLEGRTVRHANRQAVEIAEIP